MSSAVRNHYFDNLKFILIFCVVLIHSLECFRDVSASFRALYLFLGFIAMPLFAFVSGYFSKQYTPKLKDLSFVLLPYVVFQLLYILYFNGLGLEKAYWTDGWSLTTPFIQNWYLLSLLGWRWMALYARRCRFALPIAFALALLAGYEGSVGWDFSASRTICFFPFFLLGMQSDPSVVERVQRFRGLALLVLVGLLGGCAVLSFWSHGVTNQVIWKILFATPYSMPGELLSGPLFRVILYVGILVAGAAVLALVPRREMWFSARGKRTLAVFLLHNFIVLAMEKFNTVYRLGWSEVLTLVSAVGITLLLSSKVVYEMLMWPFNAVQRWLDKASLDHA